MTDVAPARERHDYRAMLDDLEAHPNQHRVVWSRPLTKRSAAQAAAVAMGLRDWIRWPHRGPGGLIACRKAGCGHHGEGTAFSRSEVVTGEAQVIGIWLEDS